MNTAGNFKVADIENFTEYLSKMEKRIETKNIEVNKHLKQLLRESRNDLVDMMDESYQDAFNLQITKDRNRRNRNE